jgi:calpain-15
MIIDKIKMREKKSKPNEEDFNEDWKLLRSSMRSKIKFNKKKPLEQVNKFESMIRTTRMSNNIDDLGMLLQNSEKYRQAQAMTKGQNFFDKDFPNNLESLLGFVQGERTKQYLNLMWHRPKEFYILYTENGKQFFKRETTENYKVYDKIIPEDIIQGRLGDCYFLAACSAIAIQPKRLERIFISGKNYNEKGLYAVAICINGIWEEILLDDYFPCNPDTRLPAFSYSKNNSLWMMLLEKAWAKVHMGYLNITCGFTGEALRDLTGAPTESHFLDFQEFEVETQLTEKNAKNWEMLCKGFKKKFIMCASSRDFNQGSDQVDERLGISGNHAYSILGVYDLGKRKFLFLFVLWIF